MRAKLLKLASVFGIALLMPWVGYALYAWNFNPGTWMSNIRGFLLYVDFIICLITLFSVTYPD